MGKRDLSDTLYNYTCPGPREREYIYNRQIPIAHVIPLRYITRQTNQVKFLNPQSLL